MKHAILAAFAALLLIAAAPAQAGGRHSDHRGHDYRHGHVAPPHYRHHARPRHFGGFVYVPRVAPYYYGWPGYRPYCPPYARLAFRPYPHGGRWYGYR